MSLFLTAVKKRIISSKEMVNMFECSWLWCFAPCLCLFVWGATTTSIGRNILVLFFNAKKKTRTHQIARRASPHNNDVWCCYTKTLTVILVIVIHFDGSMSPSLTPTQNLSTAHVSKNVYKRATDKPFCSLFCCWLHKVDHDWAIAMQLTL